MSNQKVRSVVVMLCSLLGSLLLVFSAGAASGRASVRRAGGSLARPAASVGVSTYSWNAVYSPVSLQLKSVDMASPTDGWAVGYHHRAANGLPEGQVIIRWDGNLWSERYISDTGSIFSSVDMVSSTDGWIAGGSYGSWLLRWYGDYWYEEEIPNSRKLNSVSMISADDGWAVGGSGSCPTGVNYGTILRWDGDAWSVWTDSIERSILYDVDMVNTNYGWAVGYYCYWSGTPPHTTRSVFMRWNGSNWSIISSPTIYNMYAVDMLTTTDGWAMGEGGRILRWNGTNWNDVTSPTTCSLNSVTMVSATDGWAVGGGGYSCPAGQGIILHWNGSEWSEVTIPVTGSLNSVTMLSATEGWAVGEGGAILHYTSSDQLVRVVGAGTADMDWNVKTVFQAGDPIRWYITIENDTGADADVALTYDITGPAGQAVYHAEFTDPIPPGLWYWGEDGTLPAGIAGQHTLTGTGLYMGTTTQALFNYNVIGPGAYLVRLPLVIK